MVITTTIFDHPTTYHIWGDYIRAPFPKPGHYKSGDTPPYLTTRSALMYQILHNYLIIIYSYKISSYHSLVIIIYVCLVTKVTSSQRRADFKSCLLYDFIQPLLVKLIWLRKSSHYPLIIIRLPFSYPPTTHQKLLFIALPLRFNVCVQFTMSLLVDGVECVSVFSHTTLRGSLRPFS